MNYIILMKIGLVSLVLVYTFIRMEKLGHYLRNIPGKDRKVYWRNLTILDLIIRLCFVSAIFFGLEFWILVVGGLTLFSIDRLKGDYLVNNYGEREMAKRKLDSLLALKTDAMDRLRVPIFIKKYDEDNDVFRTIYVNELFCKLLKVKKDEYEGSSDFDYWPLEMAKQYDSQDRAVFFGELDEWEGNADFQPLGDDQVQNESFVKYKEGQLLIGMGLFVKTS
ncbi:hypothetical protein [Jiulongibacter sp. NS-SX5]|uniref:hypothetical protein n=1 Tax=Jiulongibacter sp. NS-SX5 TaxID=3463854 RepID=UPI00405978E8